jgi:two-component sensor histidine kinase
MTDQAPIGLAGIEELPWGTHICQFFKTGDHLRDTLVPYFKAGLENNERCLLVATNPFSAEEARQTLRSAVGDFDRRELSQQIEIHDVGTWYNAESAIDGARMVDGLLRGEEQARTDGFNGFRTNGNIGWVGRHQWADFQDYEAQVSRGIKGRRMISLCSYCLDNCSSQDVLDVICRHDVTIDGDGRGSTLAIGVDEATRRVAEEQRLSLLVCELEHRIKNNLATVQALAASTIRSARSLEDFGSSFSGRIDALARTHSLLTDRDQERVSLQKLLHNELSIYCDRDGRRVSMSGPEIDLPAHAALPLGMALHELTTNAVKYGALSPRGGTLDIRWQPAGGNLEFNWLEWGVSLAQAPTRIGFGTQLLKRLLPHQLGAQVEMIFEADGLKARITIPSI